MRVLFATGTPAHYMAPPILGDEQVVCGPDWKDERSPDGRWLSLHTPQGEYNLATVTARLPAVQRPDVVVCLVDASWRSLPRGLNTFKCPRVLLVADTHHLKQPLLGMLRYATAEPFSRVVLLYDRHHAGVFHSAGLRNVFWLPGLTFPHRDDIVRSVRQTSAARAKQIAFVGQAGPFHPRRARLLAAMKERGLPVAQHAIPQAEALRLYGRSMLGFNASLNGDLNLRVLETISAGAALVTDRLVQGSGMPRLFTEGRDVIAYDSPEELADRVAHAFDHSEETLAIGASGARWFDENYSEERRRAAFKAVAFDGVALPMFEFPQEEKTYVMFQGAIDRLLQASRLYEVVQELHRSQELLRIAFSATVPADVATLCGTLPRVKIVADEAGSAADIVVMSVGDTATPAATGRYLGVWDARVQDRPALDTRLSPDWTQCADISAAFYERMVPNELTTGAAAVAGKSG